MSKKVDKSGDSDVKRKSEGPNSKAKPGSEGKKMVTNTGNGCNGAEKKVPLFEMKPYMRTPKLLLNNYCQKEKRPKPVYRRLVGTKGMFRYAVVLNDPKGREENSLHFETKESFFNSDLAQHYAALLALWYLESSRPLYKLLPFPLDEAWRSMETNDPVVTRSNEFVSKKERSLCEEMEARKQAEKKNRINISEQKQKLETPTLFMSLNIRRKTIGIVNKHFPMLAKSYTFKSWLFDACDSFTGLPRSVSRPKLISLNIERMNESARVKYSHVLNSRVCNGKFILLNLRYWFGVDRKNKDEIARLVHSCGFEYERSMTALNVILKEMDECLKVDKNFIQIKQGVFVDQFNISKTCIVTDVSVTNYPNQYIAWLCIMWLSIHLKESELPQLVTPKKAQIEVKDYSNMKENKRKTEVNLLSEKIKSLILLESNESTLIESRGIKGTDPLKISKGSRKSTDSLFKFPRYTHLSASKNAEEIVKKLNSSQILVVKGETGCGKTTQIPILIYEGITQFNNGMIFCSEPRRLAAISVSSRVRNEILRENKKVTKDLIGYSVRLDHSVTQNTRLVYCTHGILINIIKSELMGTSEDPSLQDRFPPNSVLILDEAHERSLDVDLLLYFMKQLIFHRRDIKLVIMSASIDVLEFVNYFNKSGSIKDEVFQVDTINLPGRTPFPIDLIYLPEKKKMTRAPRISPETEDLGFGEEYQEEQEESDVYRRPLDIPKLKNQVLKIIESLGEEEGSVLIFLGGISDVNQLVKLLRVYGQDQDKEQYKEQEEEYFDLPIPLFVLPCHSNVNYNDQLEIFKPIKGKRKVIVSTNIAEVSLTIEDIRFVIDTGRVRISMYDPVRHITSLQEVFISKSSAQQRMGRAGRTAPGKCFRLYSQEELSKQPLEITPEILRLPIEHIILDILCYLDQVNMRQKIEIDHSFEFIHLIHSLEDLFTPPKLSSIETSLLSLRNYGALDDFFRITPLGELLSKWPVDLSIGILFLYGFIFDCIDPIVTIASFLTCEIPWKLEERRLPKSSTNCDYMVFIKVYNFYVQNFKQESKGRHKKNKLNREKHNLKENVNIDGNQDQQQLPFNPECLDLPKMETPTNCLRIQRKSPEYSYPNPVQSTTGCMILGPFIQ
ncbi:putative ATP-dependent RNA helicase DHX34 [Cryptosporidium felis]|nr:putative ATP-dependent RNA helicase DHX34 [Cryptosporidium felis]